MSDDVETRTPLFPLPGAVLLPGLTLPLHIFEERYRVMTREAIEGGSPFAIARMREPRELTEGGQPAFDEIGTLCSVLHHQELDDGRFHILVGGSARVRLREVSAPQSPYRVAWIDRLPDLECDPKALQAHVRALNALSIQLAPRHEQLGEALAKLLGASIEPGTLANALASLLMSESGERQAFLEERSPERRLGEVVILLAELLDRMDGSRDAGQILN